MKQAVILCGGKGTRLGAEYSDLPKPLVPVDGVPLLDRILENAAAAGITRAILAAGHLGEQIADRYSRHPVAGLEIRTHIERIPLGTAGCLHEIAHLLDDEFALLYGDVFLDFDLSALLAEHERGHPLATVLVRQSDHPGDSDLVALEAAGNRVLGFLPKATRDPAGTYVNCANAAVYACSKDLLDFIPRDRSSDIATHVFPAALAAGREMRAYWLEETGYVKDMGTPARLREVERYWSRKLRANGARKAPRRIRAVILDRDGVILKDSGPARDPATIEFMPGALEGLALLNNAKIACVVATNQPWIARGLLTREEMHGVHAEMAARVKAAGGELLDIAFSPFHPETHHNEGIPELRRASECRKPRAGMLFELMEKHGFDPAEVLMAGDSRADILAARNAGVRSVLIGDDARATDSAPDAVCDSIPSLADLIGRWNHSFSPA